MDLKYIDLQTTVLFLLLNAIKAIIIIMGSGLHAKTGCRKGQVVSCNSIWWWCLIAIFEVVVGNRCFHRRFYVIIVPCV